MKSTTVKKPTVAVLMTCFNRRELTLSCLHKVYVQTALRDISLTVILVDDASTDGTEAAVRANFPEVEVIGGSGVLFWVGGMRAAFARALQVGFDYYLWLNDDTQLFPDALERILAASDSLRATGKTALLTGTTCDQNSGKPTYGGQSWKRGWKRQLALVNPNPNSVVECDTVNGNFTLVPHSVAEKLGNLERSFTHSFADLDYGFRAVRAGFSVGVIPGFVGTCSDNSRKGTWRDKRSTLRQRWQHLNSVKGSPFREWSIYCQRHLGLLWPLYAASPYVKVVATSLRLGGS